MSSTQPKVLEVGILLSIAAVPELLSVTAAAFVITDSLVTIK